MDYIGLTSIKDAYAESLAQEGDLDKAARLQVSQPVDPIFAGYSVHPEEEPSVDGINTALQDIAMDIQALRIEMMSAATNYNALMATINLELESAEEQITAEEERIKDMNIICGNYQEFASVKSLKTTDFVGTFGIEKNDTFTCPISGTQPVELSVLQVSGNGYEGNAYVKTDPKLVYNLVDAKNRDNIVDNNEFTYYEYSRLTSTGEKSSPADINLDKEEAQCSITIMGDVNFSAIKISSDQDNIIVKDVLTSNNSGASFKSHMKKSISINNRDEKYKNNDYVYNSGILAFPSTQYLKIVFQSNGTTNEPLQYTKIDTSDASEPKKTQVDLPNTRRHVIRINELKAEQNTYAGQAQFRTGELITTPVNSISLFASEYLPPYYPNQDGYVQYILTLNGVDHEVVPLNSYKNGIKIVRCMTHSILDSYVERMDEPIKSAKLTIIMKTQNGVSSPYVSNIKVCLGKAATKE